MGIGGITKLLQNNAHRSSSDVFKPNALLNEKHQQHSQIDDGFASEKQLAFEQGYQEAIAKAESEWKHKLEMIDAISTILNEPMKDIDQQIQEKTAEIAITIAKQVVRRELSIDSGQIVSAVKQAIDLIPKDGEKINLHVNPNDVQQVNEIFAGNDVSSKYNIIQDPSIEMGGCKALTDYSLVDLTIEKQIASIAAQIFGDQRSVT